MEHAELISGAFADVKKALFGWNNFPFWIKLFLQIVIPIVVGILAATIILQIIVKPILIDLLINDNLGFTENGLTYMLEFAAVSFGFFCIFLVPIFQGFLYRLIRTDKFPKAGNQTALFFSGWRVNIVCLFYAIPLVIIYLLFATLYLLLEGKFTGFAGVFPVGNALIDTVVFIIYAALMLIVLIIVSLFAVISLVHVARGASFRYAFSIKNSMRMIKQIGWYNYLLCLVLCAIPILILTVIFLGIGISVSGAAAAGFIVVGVYIFLLIPLIIFCCRYITKVYDVGILPVQEDTEEFDDF
ncbi:MAG: DUF4013 domain-containing protein [Methanocorpusculum sp.]|nr:DUF4013 domain-containing protein [Methanocorpusculum sp.]